MVHWIYLSLSLAHDLEATHHNTEYEIVDDFALNLWHIDGLWPVILVSDRWTGMLLYPLAPLADIMTIIIITVLLRLLFISISSPLHHHRIISQLVILIGPCSVGPGDIKR